MAILESMENLEGVLQLQKNSCLTLCNFKIPVEVVSLVKSIVLVAVDDNVVVVVFLLLLLLLK